MFAMNSHAGKFNKYITYEDFVHFTPAEQAKTIKLVHEFLIEYENYSIEKQRQQQVENKYKHYKKILNWFIQSAYSNENKIDWDPSNANKTRRNRTCLYAGWLSMTDSKGLCRHPINITERDMRGMSKADKDFFTKLHNDYKKARELSKSQKTHKFTDKDDDDFENLAFKKNKEACTAPSDIICNPKIFGQHEGSPFCVPGNSQFGLNSSLLCSEAINAITDEDGEVDKEAQAKVMEGIVKTAVAEGSKGEFFYTLGAMYETCLCAGDRTGNSSYYRGWINDSYAHRIFSTRTCYGILNQTNTIYDAFSKHTDLICENKSSLLPKVGGAELNLNWSQYMSKVYDSINASEKQSQVDEMRSKIEGLLNTKTYSWQQEEIIRKQNRKERDKNKSFYKMRQEHYQANIQAGICPIGKDDSDDDTDKKPSARLDIAIKDAEGDKAKTHSVVTLQILDLPKQDDKEADPNKLGPVEILDKYNLKLVEVGKDDKTFEPDTSDNTKQLTFTVKRTKEDIKVQGVSNYGDDLKSNEDTIPKLADDTSEKKECSAELVLLEEDDDSADEKKSAGPKKPKYELRYSFDGKDYPDGEITAPDAKDAVVSIEWFDEQKPKEEKKKKKKSKNTIDDVETEEEEKEEDKKDKKDEHKESEEVADIKKDLKKLDHDDKIDMTVTPGQKDRTIGAIITFKKDNKVICQASATTTIKAGANNGPKWDNGKSVTTPKRGGRQRRRGGANMGTDGRLRGF